MRALIALLAASALLFGAADAAAACASLDGLSTWESAGPNNDGVLYLDPAFERARWITSRQAEVVGSLRCDASGFFLRRHDTLREEPLEILEETLHWGDRRFKRVQSPVQSVPRPSIRAERPSIDEAPSTPCEEMLGTTWEIRSLDGLPLRVDRTLGSDDIATPAKAPRLIFGSDRRGTWTSVGGEKQSFGWLCDDAGLTITLSGKPFRMEREEGGFRFAGSPVRRYLPATPTPTPTP